MNVFSRGVRNAFRNGIRTFSIVLILGLSIGLALSMLMARQAVDQKIQSVKETIGNTITISPAGVRGFSGGGEPLTAEQIDKVTNTPHVTSVVTPLNAHLTRENSSLESAIEAGSLGKRFGGGAAAGPQVHAVGKDGQTMSPPIMVFGTTDSSSISMLGEVKLASGEQLNAKGDADEALIGATLADKNNLAVGSTFTAYGKTMTVKGIVDTADNKFAGNAMVLPLATLQRLSDQANAVTSATVTVDSIENVKAATDEVKKILGDTADVASQESAAENALAPLASIKDIALFGLIASIIAASVIILLSMVMIVRERRREIGVLKAIGASDTKVTLQFMVEASTFTLLAALVGIVVAVVAASPLTQALINNAQSPAGPKTGRGGMGSVMIGPIGSGNQLGDLHNVGVHIDWTILAYGLGAALLIAIIGTVVATWFITKIRPSEAIRAE